MENPEITPGLDIPGLINLCHTRSSNAGWWNDLAEALDELRDAPPKVKQRVIGWYLTTKICLMHSEVSECMEGLRKWPIKDDHLTNRDMEEVEAADILIRLFDYAGYRNLDLEGALLEKLAYNAQRADHKPENRDKEGGKAF